jgi:hypothetical protein
MTSRDTARFHPLLGIAARESLMWGCGPRFGLFSPRASWVNMLAIRTR